MNGSAIEQYSLQVDQHWYEIPPTVGAGPDWADRFVAEHHVDGLAAKLLTRELELRQRNVAVASSEQGSPLTSMLWIPNPESGGVGATLAFTRFELGNDGVKDPATFIANSENGYPGPRGEWLVQSHSWTGNFAAGPFGAVHELVSTAPQGPDPDSSTLIESTSFAVFPPGSSQYVFIVFDADSVTAFEDMPPQTQLVAETLSVRLGPAT